MNEKLLIKAARYLGYRVDEETSQYKDENGYWTNLGALDNCGIEVLEKAATEEFVEDVCYNISSQLCTISVVTAEESISIEGHNQTALEDCIEQYFAWLEKNWVNPDQVFLEIDEESLSIYEERGSDKDPVQIVYWHEDEWLEDPKTVVPAILHAMYLFYNDKQALIKKMVYEQV